MQREAIGRAGTGRNAFDVHLLVVEILGQGPHQRPRFVRFEIGGVIGQAVRNAICFGPLEYGDRSAGAVALSRRVPQRDHGQHNGGDAAEPPRTTTCEPCDFPSDPQDARPAVSFATAARTRAENWVQKNGGGSGTSSCRTPSAPAASSAACSAQAAQLSRC